MEALSVQIINPKAKLLLFDLEKMDFIRIEVKPMVANAVGLWEDLKMLHKKCVFINKEN